MPARKDAKQKVSESYPHRIIADADAHPVSTTPAARRGVSLSAANIKLQGIRLSGPPGKSSAKNLLIRPEHSADADSRTLQKSVIADGSRIIAVQG